MNPFSIPTPEDYELAFQWALGFLLFVVLSGALLFWHWKRRPSPKNHWAYLSFAVTLLSLLPVEQLIGCRLSDDNAFLLTVYAHRGRYVCSALAYLLIVMALWYMLRHSRPGGGYLAVVFSFVLSGLVGIFTYTQQLWPIKNRPILAEAPTSPAQRGGYPVIKPYWSVGFLAPSREWSEELEAVRPKGAIAELTQRDLNAHLRLFAEPAGRSLLELRDRCIEDMKLVNPNLIVEKEENKEVNKLSAMQVTARATTDTGETRFLATVANTPRGSFRMVSWCGSKVYDKIKPDLEVMHNTFQALQAQPRQ